MSDDFRQKFKTFSERMIGISKRCSNEEATKLFLVFYGKERVSDILPNGRKRK